MMEDGVLFPTEVEVTVEEKLEAFFESELRRVACAPSTSSLRDFDQLCPKPKLLAKALNVREAEASRRRIARFQVASWHPWVCQCASKAFRRGGERRTAKGFAGRAFWCFSPAKCSLHTPL